MLPGTQNTAIVIVLVLFLFSIIILTIICGEYIFNFESRRLRTEGKMKSELYHKYLHHNHYQPITMTMIIIIFICRETNPSTTTVWSLVETPPYSDTAVQPSFHRKVVRVIILIVLIVAIVALVIVIVVVIVIIIIVILYHCSWRPHITISLKAKMGCFIL